MIGKVTGIVIGNKYPLILIAVMVLPGMSWAQRQVLREITIKETNQAADIQINFGVPVRYQRYFPPKSGQILQIRLEIIEDKRSREENQRSSKKSAGESGRQESLLPPISGRVPLSHVTYEGDVAGGPYLILRFNYPIEYVVLDGRRTGDFHSIHVIIQLDGKVQSNKDDTKKNLLLMSDRKLDALMRDARHKLTAGDVGRAMQGFEQILTLPENKYSQAAKELLGLARERNGQTGYAQLEYQGYLRLYSRGEGAERVRQRLTALTRQRKVMKRKLTSLQGKKGVKVKTRGRFSQRIYNNNYSNNKKPRTTLSSYLNISSHIRGREYNIRGYLSATELRNFEYLDQGKTRLNRVYIDYKNNRYGLYGKFGRQSSRHQGVFGRFDGAWVGYRLIPRLLHINAVAGQPVSFYSGALVPDKVFYGASAEIGTFLRYWNVRAFYVEQHIAVKKYNADILDRQALGGDLRFTHRKLSFASFIDYDMSYRQLNTYAIRGKWKVSGAWKLNAEYRRQRIPLISTAYAVSGERGVSSFEGLYNTLFENGLDPETEMRDKVATLRSTSQRYYFGASYVINPNLRVEADLSRLAVSGRPQAQRLVQDDRPGIDYIVPFAASGPDYSFAARILASNYFVERDAYIVGVRLVDRRTSGSGSEAVFVENRFPFGNKWRIRPKLQLMHNKYQSANSENLRYTASLRTEYKWRKKIEFAFDLGYVLTNYRVARIPDPDYYRTYLRLGYRVEF